MKNMLAERTVRIKPSGIRKFFDLVSEMDDPEVISLGVGEPDFDTPWHIPGGRHLFAGAGTDFLYVQFRPERFEK